LKSRSGDFILQNLILRTRLCGTGFITEPSCVFDFRLTEICQSETICIGGVPGLKRHVGGADPSIFYMIHRGGRVPMPNVKIVFEGTDVYMQVSLWYNN